ncbi:MAG: redoxin domain-containing protein [Planctomycetes bacterium]|nr:redoxin domain-containing protein [Planctomycetota bacterium]
MKPRFLVLAVLFAAIAAATAWKLARTYDGPPPVPPRMRAQAPLFELHDQQKPPDRVRLKTWLGRHTILLAFFGGEGAEADPLLRRLRDDYDALRKRGIIVLGVGTTLPQENRPPAEDGPRLSERQVERAFPFPLLTDLEPQLVVHKLWGRVDETTGRPLRGLFIIDRAGRVDVEDGHPAPVPDPQIALDALLR